MQTDKPRVAILMAIYEPRMDWLREQLKSLEAQTYPNLKLYIRDDCSPMTPFEQIERCVGECIKSFPREIRRNETNLGSNGTFERLTAEAEGEYFAYCDQDDVWLPEKLETLERTITDTGAEMVCSDMYIIGGDGNRAADSITKVRKHHVFRSGAGLARGLLISNFVTGCTMMIRAETAKAAAPFCPYMVHDHYLALFAAERGKIVSLPDKLINYRIHGGNQTLVMAGVHDRASYIDIRVVTLVRRLAWLQEHFPCGGEMREEIGQALVWARARKANLTGRGGKRTVWEYRRFSPLASLFEIVLSDAPERVFMLFVALTRRNIL